MYEDILNCSYVELRDKYSEKGHTNAQKIITLKNDGSLGTLFKDSEVLVYFDAVDGNQSLLMVERVNVDELDSIDEFENRLTEFNQQSEQFEANYNVSEDESYVDVIVMRKGLLHSSVD